MIEKKVWRYQTGNKKPYIVEGQNTRKKLKIEQPETYKKKSNKNKKQTNKKQNKTKRKKQNKKQWSQVPQKGDILPVYYQWSDVFFNATQYCLNRELNWNSPLYCGFFPCKKKKKKKAVNRRSTKHTQKIKDWAKRNKTYTEN